MEKQMTIVAVKEIKIRDDCAIDDSNEIGVSYTMGMRFTVIKLTIDGNEYHINKALVPFLIDALNTAIRETT